MELNCNLVPSVCWPRSFNERGTLAEAFALEASSPGLFRRPSEQSLECWSKTSHDCDASNANHPESMRRLFFRSCRLAAVYFGLWPPFPVTESRTLGLCV